MATAYDCKFIETSVGINHNVDELLVGLLSQIRLKLENPEKSRLVAETLFSLRLTLAQLFLFLLCSWVFILSCELEICSASDRAEKQSVDLVHRWTQLVYLEMVRPIQAHQLPWVQTISMRIIAWHRRPAHKIGKWKRIYIKNTCQPDVRALVVSNCLSFLFCSRHFPVRGSFAAPAHRPVWRWKDYSVGFGHVIQNQKVVKIYMSCKVRITMESRVDVESTRI